MNDKYAEELIAVLKNIEKELRGLNARMTKIVNAQEWVAQRVAESIEHPHRGYRGIERLR